MVKALIMILMLCLAGSIAHAQGAQEKPGSPEERAACEADYKKYCASISDKKLADTVACMKQNIEKLSEQCRKHVEKR